MATQSRSKLGIISLSSPPFPDHRLPAALSPTSYQGYQGASMVVTRVVVAVEWVGQGEGGEKESGLVGDSR